GWHWVRGAERFEQPGCLGTTHVGVGERWHDVVAELPTTSELSDGAGAGTWPAPITAEVRSLTVPTIRPDAALLAALRALALGRFGRAPLLVSQAIDNLLAMAAN